MDELAVKNSAVSGIRWLLVKGLLGEFTTVATTVALARLVSPAQFGHAAVAILFLLLAVILTFEGFASALVQRPNVTKEHREAAVGLSLVGGAALAAIVFVFGRFACPPIFGPATAALIELTAPAYVIGAVGCVSRAMLWRQLAFRRMTQIDLASSFIGGIAAVGLAALGLEGRALVIGGLVAVSVTSALQVASAPEPFPRWHSTEAREIGRFGVPAALHAMVTQLFGNVDYAIVAVRMTPLATGIYYRAFSTGVSYQSKISNVMLQLAFPVYSRMKDRNEMRTLYERAARIHAVVIFPLLTLIIIVAPTAVPFAFGTAWRAAVVPTQILAGAGMAVALLTGYPQLMNAAGQPKAVLKFNVVMLVIYAAAITVAAGHGLLAVSIAADGVYLLMLGGVYQFLLKPHFGLSPVRLAREISPALVACTVLAVTTAPVHAVVAPHVPAIVTLAVVGLTGLAAYSATLRLAFPKVWQEIMQLLMKTLAPVLKLRIRSDRKGNTASQPSVQAEQIEPAISSLK